MKKMKFISGLVLLFCCTGLGAQENLSALIPMPNHIEQQTGKKDFVVSGTTGVQSDLPKGSFVERRLLEVLQRHMNVVPTATKGKSNIRLVLDPSMQGPEHYRLQVKDKELLIQGATEGALLYGVMTLDQLLQGDVVRTRSGRIAPVLIDDTPRFAYRSLMLDPARHFLPINDVKFYIDQMVRFKYNVLQLHLTDDQGWRMEIRQHPELTKNGPFYTQEELKDLVRYAAERNVQLIPEFDIPGHTASLLSVHPELACSNRRGETITDKTTNVMLCADNPAVYTLYRDILKEVAAVFPSPYIHLGGDESAIEHNWAKCTDCIALRDSLHYTEPAQLMNYFFKHILSYVRENGKRAMLWCELDNIRMPASRYLFDYPKDVTLVSWRAGLTPLCQQLTAASGHALLMAPGEYAYFDYPQYKNDFPEFNNWGMPTTTLETVYRFDPAYGKPAAEHQHILGVNGTLWGEAIPNINRATYMTYPRALALAEAGWTQMEHRSWDSFKQRLYPNLLMLMQAGVSVRVPFEIVPRQQ